MYPIPSYNLAKGGKKLQELRTPTMVAYTSTEDEFFSERRPQQQRTTTTKVESFDLFKKPRFVFGLLSQLNVMLCLLYLAPVLSIHITNYGYSPEIVGVAYGIPAILYASACPFIFLLTKKV